MTHDEIQAVRSEYAGASKRPGKFEGESDWAAYYWDKAMEGCEDDRQYDPDDDTPISIFYVDDEDRAVFPELDHVTQVWLWEDDQGFVNTRMFESDEAIPQWDEMKEHWYDVEVSNIGYVATDIENETDARAIYDFYVNASKNIPGCRTYKQDVTLLIDGEVAEEWIGYPGEMDVDPREDSDPTEPSEGDLVTEDHVRFNEVGSIYNPVLMIDENAEESMESQLKHFMDKNRLWPNVWFLSDHGNYHLMTI